MPRHKSIDLIGGLRRQDRNKTTLVNMTSANLCDVTRILGCSVIDVPHKGLCLQPVHIYVYQISISSWHNLRSIPVHLLVLLYSCTSFAPFHNSKKFRFVCTAQDCCCLCMVLSLDVCIQPQSHRLPQFASSPS